MAVIELAMNDDFRVTEPGEPLYEAACDFTASHYKSRLDCDLRVFFPKIFTRISAGEITGVCGLREAGQGALFLEQYLDGPIETILPDMKRRDVVELGGFSAKSRLEAFLLMRSTAPALLDMGFKTVVCTANRPVRGCLRRLGIQFQQLAEADLTRLSEQEDDWGSYYETSPLVLAGQVTAGVEAIEQLMKAA